eukprot:6332460-Pyramimonas_sp.AAC.2
MAGQCFIVLHADDCRAFVSPGVDCRPANGSLSAGNIRLLEDEMLGAVGLFLPVSGFSGTLC